MSGTFDLLQVWNVEMKRETVDQIRAELNWMNQPPDPSRCGCRIKDCCAAAGHEAGQCARPPTEKVWSTRWEYYCAGCREHAWGGITARAYITRRVD